MPKILFAVLHRPDRSPSQRFRFEQYLDYLKEKGYSYKYSYLVDEKADRFFYAKGKYISKLYLVAKSFFKRFFEGLSLNKYDIVFVQREALMTGAYFFEKMAAKSKAKLIFDFDDAIWLQNVSEGNKKFAFLKNPKKTQKIIAIADTVIAGNEYLSDFAKKYNQNVVLIPTTIDTHRFYKEKKGDKKKVCIGWTGSFSTIEHLKKITPVLVKIKNKYQDKVYFKVIGDPNYINEELGIKGVKWTSKTEVEELKELDIGIMPLEDTAWEKGKCACKGLQYMSLGIPTIMSPVGVNKDIVKDGQNGFLASSFEEWESKLSLLVESKELRSKLGEEGKATVLEKYSVDANKTLYLKAFSEILNY